MEQPSAFIRNKANDLILQRKKLEAVKLVYEATKCSLKEAKEYIDDLEKHPSLIPDDSNTSAFQRDLDAELMSYLRNNQKLQAVKVYKDFSGLGLAESKEYVEALESNGGVSPIPTAAPNPKQSRDTQINDLLGAQQFNQNGAAQKKPAPAAKIIFVLIVIIVVLYFIVR